MAGRIPTDFTLAGQAVHVDANDGSNNLHGGAHGFYAQLWDGEINGSRIIFTQTVRSADDHFPGDMQVQVSYTLTPEDNVAIDYSATTTATTLFNPMNHAYFNLDPNSATVLNHQLQLRSTQHYELGAGKLPNPRLIDNAGTPFDFREPTLIKDAIAGLVDTPEQGLDDIYAVTDLNSEQPVATLSVPDLALDFYSDRNAIVVYSANGWEGLPKLVGRKAVSQCGIAIELQTAPSALTAPQFGSLVVEPDHPVHYQSRYCLRR